jgi:hypothetical protein
VRNNDFTGNATGPFQYTTTASAGPESTKDFSVNGAITGSVNQTFAQWRPSRNVVVTRVFGVAQTPGATCSPVAQMGVIGTGATVSMANTVANNDSGALAVVVPSGTVSLGTVVGDAGCGTQPANLNVTVQYVVP